MLYSLRFCKKCHIKTVFILFSIAIGYVILSFKRYYSFNDVKLIHGKSQSMFKTAIGDVEKLTDFIISKPRRDDITALNNGLNGVTVLNDKHDGLTTLNTSLNGVTTLNNKKQDGVITPNDGHDGVNTLNKYPDLMSALYPELNDVKKQNLSMKSKKFPGLIIIGIQKCGTGALDSYLKIHPNMRPHKGEVHFFDTMINHNKPINWDHQFKLYLNELPK
ncbi:unnamed protein product, partial [Owenia fusiformis]